MEKLDAKEKEILRMIASNKRHHRSYLEELDMSLSSFKSNGGKDQFYHIVMANYHKQVELYQHRNCKLLTKDERKRIYDDEVRDLAKKHRDLNLEYYLNLYIPEGVIDIYSWDDK